MLQQWPIRRKLLVGLALLVVVVVVLSAAGAIGVYRYRDLVRGLELRATELPPATRLSLAVSDLRVTLAETHSSQWMPGPAEHSSDAPLLRQRFRTELAVVVEHFGAYRAQLEQNDRSDYRIDDSDRERKAVAQIAAILANIQSIDRDEDWLFRRLRTEQLAAELEELQRQSAALPGYLHQKLWDLRNEVRGQYRTLIAVVWGASAAAVAMLVVSAALFYQWLFRPLGALIDGSRRVGRGDFTHRIQLAGHDEMAELAREMNGMTERFVAIRDDLDRQVRERTRQVVRSEQLAGVGFLAAGVAHEINNPLASIAMCAESLEKRVRELIDEPAPSANEPARAAREEQRSIVASYLTMIQEQAFRCKQITEKLLDFSRLGDVARQDTDLRTLVEGVIEMIRTLGKYRGKRVELLPGPSVVAAVNPQQIKQVVLNLLANGLDSIDPAGRVTVELARRGDQAELLVRDDGCGMTPEVLEHLFEPFFTRSRGGKGTGLGLSIVWSIVADHDGQIEAHSDGPGRGAQFRLTLPLRGGQGRSADRTPPTREKELRHRCQAA